MSAAERPIVLQTDRHLKWRSLDRVEHVLMILCGLCLACFTTSVFLDVVTRTIGHPWLWLQETTMAFFDYGVFAGTAVAVRRNDHLCLSAISEALSGYPRTIVEVFNRSIVAIAGLAMVVFGWENFLQGFGSFRMPSMLPIAYLYWPIPVCGVFIALFSVEQICNGLRNGFAGATPAHRAAEHAAI